MKQTTPTEANFTRLEALFEAATTGTLSYAEAREQIDAEGLAYLIDDKQHVCDMAPQQVVKELIASWGAFHAGS